MHRRIAVYSLTVLLAFVLALSVASMALAATPANDGAGQAFGVHHAEHAQLGLIGQDTNPGMHQGFSGWMGP